MTDTTQADRQRRVDEATKHMTDRHLEDRVRAAHPHAAESDDATKAMLEDYDRLAKEQKQHTEHHADKAKA